MPRLLPTLALIALAACSARHPPMPGPLGSMRHYGEPLPPMDLPDAPDERTDPPKSPSATAFGASLADAARHYLRRNPSGYRNDCSGFAMAAFARAGLPLQGNSASFWEDARQASVTHRKKEPHIGDLAFFDNTYDRNGNGRRDDELTHVAIVIDVESDGTIVMAHGGTSRGRTTLRMNLRQPDVLTAEDGRIVNENLRSPSARDQGPTLASALWRGFATVSPEALAAD